MKRIWGRDFQTHYTTKRFVTPTILDSEVKKTARIRRSSKASEENQIPSKSN